MNSNLEKDLIVNQDRFAKNVKIISSYQSFKNEEDKQYKKYVIDDGIKYDEGCIRAKKYNDCEEFKKIIEENKIAIAKNRLIIEENHNNAIINNQEIVKTVADIKKEMNDLVKEGSDNILNNQSKYSVGVAFDNDTIYLKYHKDNPVNSKMLATLTHELLHIYSYNKSRTLPNPINEGITDYLTYQAMGLSQIDSIRAAGYPIETQVVLALLEKIKKEDLIRVYFSGKEEDFKKLMKASFPNVDYKDFSSRMNRIYNKTYRVGGIFRSFEKALIDHEEVVEIRKLLGLPDKKFESQF